MDPNSTSSEIKFSDPDYSLSPSSFDFDYEAEVNDMIFENDISHMSSLFSNDASLETGLSSFNCKPDIDAIKMFVGQIPQNYTESDLLQLFEKFGKVYEIRILKHKITGRSKGCCFVTFFTRKAALDAQNALHNIKVLPGMHHPIQMKPADSENRNDRKLFIGMLSKEFNESDVRNLFSPYGPIEECTVLRDVTGKSKGCAFVTYLTRQSAQNAVKSMHHCHIFDGCSSPLVVKFADTQKDKELRRMYLLQNDFNSQNPLSAILQQINPDTLNSLIASNNLLQQLQNNAYINPSPQYPVSNYLNFPSIQAQNWRLTPSRNNLNLQTMVNNYLLNQINNQCLTPMPVNDNLTLNNLIFQLSNAAGLGSSPQPTLENTSLYSPPSFEQIVWNYSKERLMLSQKQIEGPEGANLFIYHLPPEFTDQKLAELFNPYGRVISAKVFIDKITKLSKCFGFVSYDSVSSAKAAIQNLNGFHILGKKLKVEVKKKKPALRS